MKILLAALFCQFVFFSHLAAAQQTEITGAVAYTETIQFDYTKDGVCLLYTSDAADDTQFV